MKKLFFKTFLLVLISYSFSIFSGCSRDENNKTIKASGFIESREVDIRSEVSGKIIKLDFEEGDKFKEGDVICLIDKEKLELELSQAEAGKEEIGARLKLFRKGFRKEEIDKAKTFFDELKERRDLAKIEYERAKELYEKNILSKSSFDSAKTLLNVTQEQLKGAEQQYEITRKGYRDEEKEELEAALKEAEFKIKLIKKSIKDSVILSPVTGVVTKKLVEKGEYVPLGGIIATISDLRFVWLKIFISEKEYGKVKMGQKVKIKVDSYPSRNFEGKIIYISSEAEFTPKNIQTQDDRIKLVYALKVGIDNKEGVFKPGMPADAIIEVDN